MDANTAGVTKVSRQNSCKRSAIVNVGSVMFTPPNRSLRRLRLEELLSKIEQIEEQVSLTLREYPHGHTLERQRLVLAIAKQVRSHLMEQLRGGPRVAVLGNDAEQPHLRLVDDQQRSSASES